MTGSNRMDWMRAWPWSSPRPTGDWTVRRDDRYALVEPESGTITPIDPAADTRLPGLTPALAAGGRLLGYRHRRRAITAHDGFYTKIVRPGRVDDVVERHSAVRANDAVETPDVIGAHADGRVELSTVTGPTLHDTIRTGAALPLQAVAEALAAFHLDRPIRSSLPPAAVDLPSRWIDIVGRIEPDTRAELDALAATLPAVEFEGGGVVHTDLHDKNVIVTGRRVGLIDLDGVRIGPPELDIANLAVHLELRAIQAGDDTGTGRRAADNLIARYDALRPLDPDLMDALVRHTWFRLACLYRCRGTGRDHASAMQTRAAVVLPA